MSRERVKGGSAEASGRAETKDEEDDVLSESEEDDEHHDERRRNKLLEAIRALGGRKKTNLAERSEAAVHMSEFTVNSEIGDDRVQLSELIGTLDQTPSVPGKTRTQLKSLQRGEKTLQCPLSLQESQRIQRHVAFEKTAQNVSRWSSTITQNRRAEQLVFPLQQEPLGPRPVESIVSGWKAQTPLEQEVMALLSANKQPIHDPVLTPVEEASMKAMSLEEAKVRRAELQKARALQSYYEAKTRRERKIKSKKYHRVQNKSKRREFLKEFDAMAEKDPAAALEELQKMEVARMKERMSLKHQNSGKWAKSKAIMAKYDEGARRAMQQQLEVNKDLTQKLVTSLSQEETQEEEEQEVEEEEEEVAAAGGDVSNPWMRGKLSEDPAEREAEPSVEMKVQVMDSSDDEEEQEEGEEAALLREFERRRSERQRKETEPAGVCVVEEVGAAADTLERGPTGDGTSTERQAEDPPSSAMEEGLRRIRTLEDVEELSADPGLTEAPPPSQPEPPPVPVSAPKAGNESRKKRRGIELKQVLTKNTPVLDAVMAPTTEDAAEEEEEDLDSAQRGLIKEAFAGDDVISEFLKEKRKQEEAGKLKEVDLTLPGWGQWGGTGLKPPRKKRQRFRTKPLPPPPPRKDERLPAVIISETRNSGLSLHQLNSLPFPFESCAQFESTMRAPLGRTWNTEHTVRKVTKPRVVTRLGAIIEPISKEEMVTEEQPRSSSPSGRGVKPTAKKKRKKEKPEGRGSTDASKSK